MLAATFRRCYSFVKGKRFELYLRSSSRSIGTIHSTPMLMFSSLDTKEFRHFYEPSSKGTGNPGFKLREKLHIPQLSIGKEYPLSTFEKEYEGVEVGNLEINNAHVCIGSTLDGFLFTVPFGLKPEIHATNPFNPKEVLFKFEIPPMSTLLRPEYKYSYDGPFWEGPEKYYRRFVVDTSYDILSAGKAIFSPSKNIMVISYRRSIYFATANSSAWTCISLRVDEHFLISESSNSQTTDCSFDDFVFHNGNLLGIDLFGNLICIEFDDGATSCTHYKASMLARSPPNPLNEPHPCFSRIFFLVESLNGNDLFLVHERCSYVVFKLENDDYEVSGCRKKWTQIDNLEDIALFISPKSCFSLYASNNPNIKGNAIYSIAYHSYYARPTSPSGIEFFDLDDGKLHITYSDEYLEGHEFPPPEWYYQQPTNQS